MSAPCTLPSRQCKQYLIASVLDLCLPRAVRATWHMPVLTGNPQTRLLGACGFRAGEPSLLLWFHLPCREHRVGATPRLPLHSFLAFCCPSVVAESSTDDIPGKRWQSWVYHVHDVYLNSHGELFNNTRFFDRSGCASYDDVSGPPCSYPYQAPYTMHQVLCTRY